MFDAKKLKGKRACVLGLGKTGLAATNLLHKKKFGVFISDTSLATPELPKGILMELGIHTDKVLECDFIIKSPGILPSNHILKKARAKKIPVYSEVEFALAFIPKSCKVFAVTGTNGKTTTTMLLSEILKEFCKEEGKGRRVYTVGNIGVPASEVADNVKAGDFLVLEMSSYQLEDSTHFAPDAAAILNITPDHVAHHGTFKKYLEAKAKVFKYQNGKNIAVVNAGDKYSSKMAKSIKANVMSFATSPLKEMRSHVFFDGDEIVFNTGERLRPPALPGLHNVENAMAAAILAISQGVGADTVQRAFNKFRGAEHRIESFFQFKGITCINDSKSTNIDSTITALKAVGVDKKIWLILGGQDKGSSYEILLPYLHKYCKKILTIGEAMEKIERELKNEIPLKPCGNLKISVKYAYEHAKKGDILLLSPACASFDQFKNFEERGTSFKKLCRSLAKESNK